MDHLAQFFSAVQKDRKRILKTFGGPSEFCTHLVDSGPSSGGATWEKALSALGADDRDYAISSAYALLIEPERRQELAAYFTPPKLAKTCIDIAMAFMEPDGATALDPACGGGSFVVPLARQLIRRKVASGTSVDSACTNVLRNLRGADVELGLARLTERLLIRMLSEEFDWQSSKIRSSVSCKDSLRTTEQDRFNLVIGNPPYGRVLKRYSGEVLEQAGLANNGGHTNLYSLFILKGLQLLKPGGGLVFVVPTSFVAGPYFAGLRAEILSRSEVVRIDTHDLRSRLFLGAVQDVCILTLRRHRNTDDAARSEAGGQYVLGTVDAKGSRTKVGGAVAFPKGEPWLLPGAIGGNEESTTRSAASFNDYGYKIRVGNVVPTKERKKLHVRRERGDLPLVWASAVREDGAFNFEAAKAFGNAQWYRPAEDAKRNYVVRNKCVIVQRTSNKSQKRRLNAAVVPEAFLSKHKKSGFVGENHVIILESLKKNPKVSPSRLAALINSGALNKRFESVTGSFSISAKLLSRLALPEARRIPLPKKKNFEKRIERLFERLPLLLPTSIDAGKPKIKKGAHK